MIKSYGMYVKGHKPNILAFLCSLGIGNLKKKIMYSLL